MSTVSDSSHPSSALHTMDSDPWADAPPTSSRKGTPVDPAIAKLDIQEKTGPSAQTCPPADPSSLAESSAVNSPPADETIEESGPADEDDVVPKSFAQAAPAQDDGFDDFDDFDASGPSGAVDGEGFGDFGDFEDGDFDAPEQVSAPVVQAAPQWTALPVRPVPKTAELIESLGSLLSPWFVDKDDRLTDEPPRQSGIGQIMPSESSREAYKQLCTPPMLKTLDWTRSRVRRDHLISMGIPVNLDEVDSHRLSALPPLRIVTNSAATTSLFVDSRRRSVDKGKGKEVASVPASAASVSRNGEPRDKYGLGPMPMFDSTMAEDLCGLEEEGLALSSVQKLKGLQDELVQVSAQASALLAWHLQYKDAQSQDSSTYNGMISELIANAAKAKSAQNASGGRFGKRSSARSPVVGTPRVSSPAMR